MVGAQTGEQRSAWLAGVVAEDQPAAALAAGTHDPALGRGRELLEHLGVEAPVPARDAGPRRRLTSVRRFSIRFHAVESTEGTSAVRLVPFERWPAACSARTFGKCICVPWLSRLGSGRGMPVPRFLRRLARALSVHRERHTRLRSR